MRTLLETAGFLVILFLLFRVSLAARGRGFGLRGGLTALNIASGALAGLAAALLIADGMPGMAANVDTGAGGALGGSPAAGGYDELAAALRTLAPYFGAALGSIAGYQVFGAGWRALFRSGTAQARAWLLRLQFAILALSCAYLIGRLFA